MGLLDSLGGSGGGLLALLQQAGSNGLMSDDYNSSLTKKLRDLLNPPDPNLAQSPQYPPQLNMAGFPLPSQAAPQAASQIGTGTGSPFGPQGLPPIGQMPQAQMPSMQQAAPLPDAWAGLRGNGGQVQPQGPQTDQTALPIPSSPAQYAPPQQQQQPMLQGPSFDDKLNAGFQGFANAKGLLPAIGNMMQGLTTGQRTDPAGMVQQKQRAIYMAVLQHTGDPALALAAASSDKVLETAMEKPKFQQIGEDQFGGKTFGYPPNPYQGGASNQGGSQLGAPQAQPQGGGYLATGVTQVNHDLKGDDYLKQFSPEVQSAVQNYVEGKSMPTGNPRKGFTQTIKMIAQKYGADTGQEVNDDAYTARRAMRTQLSSASPGSMGGQTLSSGTALGHLNTVADKGIALQNWDTGMFPDVAHFINWAREHGSTEQAAKANAFNDAIQRYSAEITKLYSGSQGGMAERDASIQRLLSTKTPKELGAAIQSERELLHSRLLNIEGQVRDRLGPKYLESNPIIQPKINDMLPGLDAKITQLRLGRNAGLTAAPQPQAAPSPGRYIWTPDKGLVPQ